MTENRMRPVHPGEVLREEFLRPLGMSASFLASALHLPSVTLEEIVQERKGISAGTAYSLSRYFNTSAEFWLNLHMTYEKRKAQLAG